MAHSLKEEGIVTREETGATGETPPGTPPEDICKKLPDGTLIQCSGEFVQQALTENQEKKERGKEQDMERETKKKEKELAICSPSDIKPRLNPLKCGNHHAKCETKVMEIWNKHLHKMHETRMRIVLFAPLLYDRSTLAPKWQQWMRKLDLIIDDMAPLEMKKEVFFRLDEMDCILGYMGTQLLTMKSEDYNCMMGLLEDIEKVEELQMAMEIAKSNPYFTALYDNLKTRNKMEDSSVGRLMALVTIKQYWQYVHQTVIHKEDILASVMKLSEKEEKEINRLKDKGNNLFRNGEFRRAHEMYTKALAMGVFNYLLYGNRCRTSLHMEDFWDALWDARRAVTVKPFWQKGHYLYARAFFELQDIDRALRENKRGQKLCDDGGSQTGDLQRQATMLNNKRRKLLSLNSKKNEVHDLVSESESDSDSDSGNQANYLTGQGSISSRELQELSTSEKPWKPCYKRGPEDKDEESVKTEMTTADDNIQLGPGRRGFNRWGRGTIGASNKKQSTSYSPSSLEEDSAPTQARSKEMAPPRVEKKEEPTMTDAKVKHTSKATVDKFLNLRDFAEATRCVSELPSKQRHLFVQATVDHVIEKKQDMREAVGVLFHSLMNSNLLTKVQYLTGMKDMIEFAEDMAIDIPKIYEYLGELMSAMLVGGAEYLKLQAIAITPLREQEKAGVLLAEILRTASRRIGTGKVQHIWQEADLKWEDFLAEGENVRELVQEKGVEFTLDGASAADNGLNGESSQGNWLHVFKRGLTNLLNERPDNDRIFDWIEHNISDTQKQHSEFIRALVTIICQNTAEGEGQSCRIYPEILKLCCPVLQRYIDNKRPLELQALYAVQALNHSLHSPPGLLRILFDVLYDEDVVTEEAFYNWKKSDDPKESAGKGVALKSATSFFTWLAEADAEAD